MIANFEVEDIIYIKKDNLLYDIHNEYNFIRFDFNDEHGNVSLYWKSVSSNSILKIEHKNIKYYLFNKSFINAKPAKEDSKTISSITFYSSLDRKTNDHITDQKKPSEEDDIIYYFENEDFIRVGCKEIFFEEKK